MVGIEAFIASPFTQKTLEIISILKPNIHDQILHKNLNFNQAKDLETKPKENLL